MTDLILAEFKTAHEITGAAQRAADAGRPAIDALLPQPIEGIADYLAPPLAKAPIGSVMFVAGVCGAVIGYGMEWFSAVIAYPILSGGRPLNSWPVFLPVPYEITILLAGICGLLGWMYMCGLPKLHHPLFDMPAIERATRDRYFLLFRRVDTTPAWISAHLKPAALHEVAG
ncbi:MAG TPA: DUF3341 domain-containing protein [Stellaceae bacterium]|jgi:hypothetical protein